MCSSHSLVEEFIIAWRLPALSRFCPTWALRALVQEQRLARAATCLAFTCAHNLSEKNTKNVLRIRTYACIKVKNLIFKQKRCCSICSMMVIGTPRALSPALGTVKPHS